ncbi:MAG: alpha/beta fold hydrolase [Candidatus Poriferisodalaceae bacterium]
MTNLQEFQVSGHAGELHARLWQPSSTPRALVFILHGYAEHGGRYAHVAEALAAADLAVLASDHVGHGLSGGERALITDFGLVVNDLNAVVSEAVNRLDSDIPLLLAGHSMGGLLAARFVQRWPDRAIGAAFFGAVIGDWKWAREVLELPSYLLKTPIQWGCHGTSMFVGIMTLTRWFIAACTNDLCSRQKSSLWTTSVTRSTGLKSRWGSFMARRIHLYPTKILYKPFTTCPAQQKQCIFTKEQSTSS